MELYAYIRLLRRWFWLILLMAFITGGTAFLYRSRQTNVYEAQIVISVGSFIEAPNPDSSEITTGVELALTYVHLAKTHIVLEATIEDGNFPLTAKHLENALSASAVPDTSLIKLVVKHTDPALAVSLADEVGEQLILHSPSNLTPQQQSQIDLANSEIVRLEQQLEQERLRLAAIQSQIEATTDPNEVERLTAQYNQVITNINQASANIAQFSDTVSALQQRTNSLDIVDPARILDETPGANIYSTVILGAMVGAALAFGLVLLYEYLDNSIRTVSEAMSVLTLPALAAIPRFGKKGANYRSQLITYHEPQSPISEEYRALRTNIMYSSNGNGALHQPRAYVVTSAGPGEGKTITAGNMAIAMAMAGWQVLLVDSDLRRPRLHDLFGVENQYGLSTLLSTWPEHITPNEATQVLRRIIRKTHTPGLSLITSGHIPQNPTEVLGSLALRKWYEFIQTRWTFDIVLFDTPPIIAVADAPVLASLLDVPVLLVVRAGQSRPESLLRSKEKLEALDIDIKGFVLNALDPKDQDGYDQGYYYYYYQSKAAPAPQKKTPPQQD